jgi:hypothetical protein
MTAREGWVGCIAIGEEKLKNSAVSVLSYVVPNRGKVTSTERPLLIVKIMGGLGNQLFQYALGRTLSLRLGATLAFDLADLGPRAIRRFGLDAFHVEGRSATDAEVRRLRGARSWWSRLLGRPESPPATYVHERHLWTYDPSWLPTEGESYLEGWWQSERYFIEQESLLRAEFVLRRPFTAHDQALAERMAREPSVSVHIRRGDYVTDPGTRRFYGEYSLEWLERAVEKVCRLESKPTFYVFSDDPQWVAQHVRLPGRMSVVSDGRRDPAQELVLMARCRHHLVTNSSYSWWGAWLGRKPGGLTIGPRQWNVAGVPAPDVVPVWWMHV